MTTSGRGRDSGGAGPSAPPIYGAAPSDAIRARMDRDGCDCPDFVRRCAHFEDDKRLWLVEDSLTGNCCTVGAPFAVSDGAVKASSCGGPHTVLHDGRLRHSAHSDYAEADAEFDRRAEALRLGGCDE